MNNRKYNVAILGATGNVGRLLLDVLIKRDFPFNQLKLLASERSAGTIIQGRNGVDYPVEAVNSNSFTGIDIVLASAGSSISQQFSEDIVKAGAVLIDNSSAFRMDENVPLVVPEVNPEALKLHQGIIANPNCSTAPLVCVLKPLQDYYGIERVVVSTYQSISGAGKAAMEELIENTQKAINKESFVNNVINQKLAFNLIPQIDVFLDNGYTKEEMKVILESRKILGLPELKITCTAVRVPVLICHSESINIELKKSSDVKEFKEVISSNPNVKVIDSPSEKIYPMPISAQGKDSTFVGRIRKDESKENTFNIWLVSDNLRKGAALNTVQIAESMIKQGII
ncbi:MAG: aspartate-semialdehyde dehydrogenase [Cyanobacteria bacterium REEB446]|jgi:aspartate-semialdehyde dehydrogenase|nr:aspartate-semialdehyde dehydrogenase [Cyanobacteria bacterium REEB446]